MTSSTKTRPFLSRLIAALLVTLLLFANLSTLIAFAADPEDEEAVEDITDTTTSEEDGEPVDSALETQGKVQSTMNRLKGNIERYRAGGPSENRDLALLSLAEALWYIKSEAFIDKEFQEQNMLDVVWDSGGTADTPTGDGKTNWYDLTVKLIGPLTLKNSPYTAGTDGRIPKEDLLGELNNMTSPAYIDMYIQSANARWVETTSKRPSFFGDGAQLLRNEDDGFFTLLINSLRNVLVEENPYARQAKEMEETFIEISKLMQHIQLTPNPMPLGDSDRITVDQSAEDVSVINSLLTGLRALAVQVFPQLASLPAVQTAPSSTTIYSNYIIEGEFDYETLTKYTEVMVAMEIILNSMRMTEAVYIQILMTDTLPCATMLFDPFTYTSDNQEVKTLSNLTIEQMINETGIDPSTLGGTLSGAKINEYLEHGLLQPSMVAYYFGFDANTDNFEDAGDGSIKASLTPTAIDGINNLQIPLHGTKELCTEECFKGINGLTSSTDATVVLQETVVIASDFMLSWDGITADTTYGVDGSVTRDEFKSKVKAGESFNATHFMKLAETAIMMNGFNQLEAVNSSVPSRDLKKQDFSKWGPFSFLDGKASDTLALYDLMYPNQAVSTLTYQILPTIEFDGESGESGIVTAKFDTEINSSFVMVDNGDFAIPNASNSLQYSVSVLEFYRWFSNTVSDLPFLQLEETQEKEDARAIDQTPQILFNFIQKTDTKPYYHLTENMVMGLCYSALFKPLQTNIEEFDFELIPSRNFMQFHNKYGSLRKALLISTQSDPVGNFHRTNSIGSLRAATLQDIVKNVGADKLLIVDQGYYNKDDINYEATAENIGDYLGTLSQQKEQGTVDAATVVGGILGSATGNAAGGAAVGKAVGNEIAKDSPAVTDAVELFNQAFGRWREQNFALTTDTKNDYQDVFGHSGFRDFIDMTVVNENLGDKGISPYTGLSVQKTVLTDTDLANKFAGQDPLQKDNKPNMGQPVWMSTSRQIDGIHSSAHFNYMLLANIVDNSAIRYNTSLDMSSPIFMDVYGNILTESGVVIIPAAANATLQRDQKMNWMTAANLLYYGSSVRLEKNKSGNPVIGKVEVDLNRQSVADVSLYVPQSSQTGLTIVFQYDEYLKRYYINPVIVPVNGVNLNTAAFNSGSENQQRALYNLNRTIYDVEIATAGTAWDFNKWLCSGLYEVTRGAKASQIRYDRENLYGQNEHSKETLMQAAKFEQFHEGTASEIDNALISIPDLAYMEGLEYIIFFAYRIATIVLTLGLCVQVYKESAKSKLSPVTFLKIFGNLALVVCVVIYIPTIFNYSYYQVNRFMLQKEATTISALNAEKRNAGIELGVLQAKRAESGSEVLIKVADIEIPWYLFLRDVLASPEVASMNQVYEKYVDDLPVASDAFVVKGSKAYMSIEDLFNSSDIQTSTKVHQMRQVVRPLPDASFYIPYYAITDYLIHQINTYNAAVERYNYDTYYYGDGRLRSVGLAKDYFLSDAFLITQRDIANPEFEINENVNELTLLMSSYDKIGIYQFYDMQSADSRKIFTDEAKEQMALSQWHVGERDASWMRSKVQNLDYAAVKYVLDNKDLLGRVSDETFIKMLALHMSMQYNKEFNSGGPSFMEIFRMDNEDLMRLSIAPIRDVMLLSPYNYAKFLLEVGGLPAVYSGALLDMVLLAASFVKPIATLFIFLAMALSLYVFKILLGRQSDSLRGMVYLTGFLIAGNLLYAIVLKGSMMLPGLGLPPFVCICIQIVLQGMYVYYYAWLAVLVVRNWRDLGAGTFANVISMRSMNLKKVSTDTYRVNKMTVDNVDQGEPNVTRGRRSNGNAWSELERMRQQDADIRDGFDDD